MKVRYEWKVLNQFNAGTLEEPPRRSIGGASVRLNRFDNPRATWTPAPNESERDRPVYPRGFSSKGQALRALNEWFDAVPPDGLDYVLVEIYERGV